jgi:hypothetical protein
MDKSIDHIIERIRDIRNWDKVKIAAELNELAYYARRSLFSQIPSVSAVAGLLAGSWVSGTFTNSRTRGFLSSVGLAQGGTHVVSTTTYRFLSVALPVLAMALTAYVVQKVMRNYRGKQLERNMAYAALLKEEVQAELQAKMAILDQAKGAGLLSESEHRTKVANLYQLYIRNDRTRIEETIIRKIEG